MNNSEHTKTTMDGGRNGGQNHSLAKRIRERDQDQLTAQIKPQINSSPVCKHQTGAVCLLTRVRYLAIYERWPQRSHRASGHKCLPPGSRGLEDRPPPHGSGTRDGGTSRKPLEGRDARSRTRRRPVGRSHSALVIRQLSVAMVRGPLTGAPQAFPRVSASRTSSIAYQSNRQHDHGEAKAHGGGNLNPKHIGNKRGILAIVLLDWECQISHSLGFKYGSRRQPRGSRHSVPVSLGDPLFGGLVCAPPIGQVGRRQLGWVGVAWIAQN